MAGVIFKANCTMCRDYVVTLEHTGLSGNLAVTATEFDKTSTVYLDPADTRRLRDALTKVLGEKLDEVTPAGPKFKVGDRVMFNGGDAWCADVSLGDIGVVTYAYQDGGDESYSVQIAGDEWGLPAASLDPANKAPTPAECQADVELAALRVRVATLEGQMDDEVVALYLRLAARIDALERRLNSAASELRG